MRCTLAAAVVVTVLCAVSAAQKKKPDGGAETPPKAEDPYAGKTVRNGRDGMGLARYREKFVPKVGQIAPDFELKTADGKRTVRLSSFRGKRPVVLVFGSLT